MTFAADTAAIFAGPLARDVNYTAESAIGSRVVRAIVRRPDTVSSFASSRIASITFSAKLQVDEVPDPKPGEIFEVEPGKFYEIQGEPLAEPQRLVWEVELVRHEL